MKFICSLLIFLIAFATADGQQPANDLPPFKKNPTLPPLELVQANNKPLRNNDLAKAPTLIIYFSPTCDHCIEQMKEMQQHMKALKKFQVIMSTYQPMEELNMFIKKYELEKYPFIRLGRDVKYLLPPFYKMASMPYLALYDKKGALITTFEGTTKMDRVFKAFEK
jgi:cytochrome oxidase Cu insertion factor (SCO1/SenC/PrrC family)